MPNVYRLEWQALGSLRRRLRNCLIGMRAETYPDDATAAFDKGGAERVTRLYQRDDLPEDRCWLRAPGWCLADKGTTSRIVGDRHWLSFRLMRHYR